MFHIVLGGGGGGKQVSGLQRGVALHLTSEPGRLDEQYNLLNWKIST